MRTILVVLMCGLFLLACGKSESPTTPNGGGGNEPECEFEKIIYEGVIPQHGLIQIPELEVDAMPMIVTYIQANYGQDPPWKQVSPEYRNHLVTFTSSFDWNYKIVLIK